MLDAEKLAQSWARGAKCFGQAAGRAHRGPGIPAGAA